MGKSAMKKTPLKVVKAKGKAKAATKKKPLKEGEKPLRQGNKPLQEGKQTKTKQLNKKNLEKLGELTLGERVALAAEEETEEAAVETLKEGMSKIDHSKAWGQHNTWLKKQPKAEQDAHANKTKKEKGDAVCLWLLKKNTERFQHHSQEVKGSSSVLQKERWVSQKTILKAWSEDELDAHLESGRILARQCKKTPGVWEYCDTEDEEKIRKASKIKSLKQGQEYNPDENDDEEFASMWQSSSHSQMHRLCDDKGAGKGGAKGSGKALKEGSAKGKKRGLLALKDKEEEEEEEEKEQNPEDELKDAMKKAKRARDLTQSQSTDLEDALVKASPLLTKEGKRKGLEQQQELQKVLQQLKAVCSKEHLPLTKLKDLLVEVSKCHKASKDTIKELKHLANRASSKAPSKRSSR